MLAIRLRVSPCNERCVGSSDARSTRKVPSSVTIEIWRGTLRDNSPLGPLTRTLSSATSMVTVVGTVIGILPIRDMLVQSSVQLPDVGQDFAAHLEATRPSATRDALRRGQDGR